MKDISNLNILIANSQTVQAINNVSQCLPKSEHILPQRFDEALHGFEICFDRKASLNGIHHRESIVSINGSFEVGFDRSPQREVFISRYSRTIGNFSADRYNVIPTLIQSSVKKGACIPPRLSGHYYRKIGSVLFKAANFGIQRLECDCVLADYQRQACKMVTCISNDHQQIEIWVDQLVDLKDLFPQAQANQFSMSLFTSSVGPVHSENSPRGSRNSKNAGYEGLKLRDPVSPRVSTDPIGQLWSFTEYRRNNQSHEKHERQKPHHSPKVMSAHVSSKTIEFDLLHLSQIGGESQGAAA